MRNIILLVGIVLCLWMEAKESLGANVIDTTAKQLLLIDTVNNTVLLEKNSSQRMLTSSMSKIMTLYLIFEALESGHITLDDRFVVSAKAHGMRGSRMFVEQNSEVRVEELILGVVVHSGNDASVVLAEGLAGSEEKFADLMNQKAKELEMTNSHFVNASGWPHPDHYSTAKDIALLTRRTIEDFPQYYHYYKNTAFLYNNKRQVNRNDLLLEDSSVDGLKTGYSNAAGYGLAASAIRDDRRLILVMNGLADEKTRVAEGIRLIEWGFSTFRVYTLFEPQEIVDRVPLWLGKKETIAVMVPEGLKVTLSQTQRDSMKVTLSLDKAVSAPVSIGEEVGVVKVTADAFVADPVEHEVPLVTAESIPQSGFFKRVFTFFKYSLREWLF